MTQALALGILGLDETADKEQVIKAHRSLMQKMHPDRGGSDYLAQKINAAKDFLMQKL
jgi:DnaJ-class molecular chaperone